MSVATATFAPSDELEDGGDLEYLVSKEVRQVDRLKLRDMAAKLWGYLRNHTDSLDAERFIGRIERDLKRIALWHEKRISAAELERDKAIELKRQAARKQREMKKALRTLYESADFVPRNLDVEVRVLLGIPRPAGS